MNGKKIQVVYKSVDELIPYINNPRLNDDAVDAVASSIKNFGFKNPIVIDSDNEIINGHTRLKAAKKLGLDTVPVIVADDLTEAQKKAFRLVDNKVSEIAEWDIEKLDIELEELNGLDLDMSAFGFGEAMIDVDLDNVFFEEEDNQEKEKENYLTFGEVKIKLNSSELKALNEQHEMWTQNNTDSFIEFIGIM